MAQPPGLPRIAVCDASEISRIGISSSLAEHGLRVAATGHDRFTALAVAASGRRQVLLVDMGLPPAPDTAVDVIAEAAAAGSIPIAIGVQGSPELIFTALRAGAAGFLTKDMPGRAWADAIRAAVRGEAPLSRTMTAQLITEFRAQAQTRPLSDLIPSDRRLTRREWQVLELIAEGDTNRAVAHQLCISVETVRSHVSNILSKLEAPNRSAAAVRFEQLRAGMA